MDNMQTGRSLPRRGFTLVEVLVVLFTVGVLLGLTIPAVQRSRTKARQIECLSRIRQLGVAMQAVISTSGRFPTGDRIEGSYKRLLPHMDAMGLYDAIVSKDKSVRMHLPILFCPEDRLAELESVGGAGYLLNEGTVFGIPNGITKYVDDLSTGEISDGLSNTAAMAERLWHPEGSEMLTQEEVDRDPRRFFWWTERRFVEIGQEDQAVAEARQHRVKAIPQMRHLPVTGFVAHSGYDHMLCPNEYSSYNGPEDFSIVRGSVCLVPPSSRHFGGVNVLLADGSARFVSDDIDEKAWRALGSRNGGEATKQVE